MKSRFLKEKIENQVIKMGLLSAAVVLTLSDAALRAFLAFPHPHDSINKILKNLSQLYPKSFGENLSDLKEITGFNLRMILLRLERKGLVNRSSSNYQLTSKGKKLAEKLKDKIGKIGKWDGKWRLVTFDIPENQRHYRDWFRQVLYEHDYKPLHKSVFVGKSPLPQEIYREIYSRKLVGHVRLLTIGEIDEDSILTSFSRS